MDIDNMKVKDMMKPARDMIICDHCKGTGEKIVTINNFEEKFRKCCPVCNGRGWT